jgi:hypothetical protein
MNHQNKTSNKWHMRPCSLQLGAADGGHARAWPVWVQARIARPVGCWYEKKFLDSGDKVSIDLLEEESGNGWHDYDSIYVII